MTEKVALFLVYSTRPFCFSPNLFFVQSSVVNILQEK